MELLLHNGAARVKKLQQFADGAAVEMKWKQELMLCLP